MTNPADVESPKSDFVREMEAALARRLEAATRAGKKAVDREIADIVKRYLGRDAWQAMVDAEKAEAVPRDTTRDRSCHRPARRVRGGSRRRYAGDFDHKLAQAGDRNEE